MTVLLLPVLHALWEELVLAPVWWYGRGLKAATNRFLSQCRNNDRAVGWSIWLKNIFVPMYGQSDMAGRAISFFMRIILLVARTVAIVVMDLLTVFGYMAYIFLPLLALAGLIFSLSKLAL